MCDSNTKCTDGTCCSGYNYCGITKDHCGIGCQSNCGIIGKTYSTCNKNGQFAFTWDDGPSTYTPQLLNILKANNIKATFFVIGQHLNDTSLRTFTLRAFKEGHTIAGHTWSHPYLSTLSASQIIQELTQTTNLIEKVIGKKPKFFRPPFFAYNKMVDDIAKSLGLIPIMASVDTRDFEVQATNPSAIITNVGNVINSTSITNSWIDLQHDITQNSINQVQNLINLVKKQNFKIVTMETCIGITPYN
jgi:peptidoglycan/xylan/chitin deacetylase (PgdA/CDA1 family)